MRAVSAIFAAALLLGGCQTMNDVASVVTGPSSPEPAPAVTPPAPSLATAAPVPAGDPSGMLGMTGDALRDAWGEPSLKRTENGVEMWQYGSGRTCTLLVYLYANAASTMAVTYVEALPGGTGTAALATCAKAAGKPLLMPTS